MATLLDKLRRDLSARFPGALVHALLASYTELKHSFLLGKHEPSELNGGKVVEASVRIIQNEITGSFIPLGHPINNMGPTLRSFESAPSSVSDSFRLHIPRVLVSIYNIRNRRGVGHLGGDVSPNLADATLLAANCDWVLAELYRIAYGVTLEEAQGIADELVRRKITLVYEVRGMKRVLAEGLTARDKTLLLLASVSPNSMKDRELLKHIEYSNLTVYRRDVLRVLHRKRFIEFSESDGACSILPPGQARVETNYETWIRKMNER